MKIGVYSNKSGVTIMEKKNFSENKTPNEKKKKSNILTFSDCMNNFYPLAKIALLISLTICLAASICLAIMYSSSDGLSRINIHTSLSGSVSSIMISVIIALGGSLILDYSHKHDKHGKD